MKVGSVPANRVTAQKLIRSQSDIRAGVQALRRRCAVMRELHERNGDPPLRRYRADFAGLARIIVGQQLSIASAAAIWSRLDQSLVKVDAEQIARASPDMLTAAGLSGAKIRTLKALALATRGAKPALRIDRLARVSDEDVRQALTQVHGIGPWTADIFIMFCLGRADAWAAGDLALQVGVARAFALGERLSTHETLELAEKWRPWRGIAARLIWADYAHLRGRQPGSGGNDAMPLGPDPGRGRQRPRSSRPPQSRTEP